MKVPRKVRARKWVRPMRGGCRAHLIEADDGASYVVKFANNPQGGRRTLINEMLASLLFAEAGIATPEAACVAVDGTFLDENPQVAMVFGERRIVVEPGLHFGSPIPGGAGQPVYDFLPDAKLPELDNRTDFLGALVMDKWLSNGDQRQAVFYRARLPGREAVGWFAQMIDHGGAFQGREWLYRNSPAQGMYSSRSVYGESVSLRDFEPWLEAISDLRPADIEGAFARLPPEWIGADEPALRALLKTLYARRVQTRALVADSVNCFWGRSAVGSSVVLQFCAFR